RWSASGRLPAAGEDGVLFRFLNTSKRSTAVDYTSPAGRERVLSLAAGADIVVESLGPGTLEDLGLGPEVVWARNPRVSVVSISPFGRGGPGGPPAGAQVTPPAGCRAAAPPGPPGP